MRKTLFAAVLLPSITFAAGQYDGTYKGPVTVVRSNGTSLCANAANRPNTINIVENRFDKPWQYVTFHATVNPDGSFNDKQTATGGTSGRTGGSVREVTIVGRVSGNSLEADISSIFCAVHLSLKKG